MIHLYVKDQAITEYWDDVQAVIGEELTKKISETIKQNFIGSGDIEVMSIDGDVIKKMDVEFRTNLPDDSIITSSLDMIVNQTIDLEFASVFEEGVNVVMSEHVNAI